MAKQFYSHYTLWEDFNCGMWNKYEGLEKEGLSKCISLLQNPELGMIMVTKNWNISTKVNLSDKQQNRKSWLGQAACCIIHGVPENITRKAWMMLTEQERDNANQIAKKVIEQWEKSQ